MRVPGGAIFAALPCLFAVAIAISFTKDSGTAGLSAVVGWLIFNSIQSVFVITNSHVDDAGKTIIDSYDYLFYHFEPSMFESIFTSNFGIASLQTSVFGGIVVGGTVAVLYNKFKNIQLPSIIGFFSGIRFIPIISFVVMLALGILFSVV
jgi:PTS system glucose-specific IIC component